MSDTTKAMNELYEKFAAPFPEEAYSVDSSRGFDLTSVKAQYIVERLNNVLGFTNWRLEGEFEEKEDGGVLFQGKLVLFLGNFGKTPDGNGLFHYVPTVGYCAKKKLLGDTYKSAKTDALSKAASYIGIANDVFKGLIAPNGKAKSEAKVEVKQEVKSEDRPKLVKPASFQGKPAKTSSDF